MLCEIEAPHQCSLEYLSTWIDCFLCCMANLVYRLGTRPPQIFFGKLGQTPQLTLGQILTGHQFISQFRSHLTTSMRLQRSLVWLELVLSGDLRSLIHVVKQLPNSLKISVQSGFGPKSTVEIVPVFQKKNWGGLLLSAHLFIRLLCICYFW